MMQIMFYLPCISCYFSWFNNKFAETTFSDVYSLMASQEVPKRVVLIRGI